MRRSQQKIGFAMLCALLAAGLFILFPAPEYSQAYISGFVFLVLFPYFVIRFLFRETLKNYGFGIRISKNSVLLTLFILAIAIFLSFTFRALFPTLYTPNISIGEGFLIFFLYTGILYPLQTFLYEFFFRAFIQRSVESVLGIWAILLQEIALICFLGISGGGILSSFNLILGGMFSGVVFYLTKSFWLCFLFSWLFGILTGVMGARFFAT